MFINLERYTKNVKIKLEYLNFGNIMVDVHRKIIAICFDDCTLDRDTKMKAYVLRFY